MSNLLSSLGSSNDYKEVEFGEEIGSVEGATIVRRIRMSSRIVAYDEDGTELLNGWEIDSGTPLVAIKAKIKEKIAKRKENA
tara:strand:+ start:572 stop:817 length:246 start_codon:yes stop_codon:yes gene_type:complete